MVVGAVVCLSLLHRWQLSRLATALLKHAHVRENEEKWLEAAAYYDRYLGIHPTDVATRCQLANVYSKVASTPSNLAHAIELHYRAIAAIPSEAEVIKLRSTLAQLLIESRRFLEAEREA